MANTYFKTKGYVHKSNYIWQNETQTTSKATVFLVKVT